MADEDTFTRADTKVVNLDQFHRASTIWPVHHPIVNTTCSLDTSGPCSIETYSVTESSYNSLNDFTSLERYQVAAWELRTKLKSRQSFRIAAGEEDADFHQYDEIGNRCAEINQAALDWAIEHSSEDAVKRYQ